MHAYTYFHVQLGNNAVLNLNATTGTTDNCKIVVEV